MKQVREFYVVKNGTTMLTYHPEIEAEEKRFRQEVLEGLSELRASVSELREDMRVVNKRLDNIETEQTIMRNDIHHIHENIDHLRHVIYWGFAIIAIVIALCSKFMPLYSEVIHLREQKLSSTQNQHTLILPSTHSTP